MRQPRRRPAAPATPGRPDADAARRRGKATLGSTSLRRGDAGPFEPDWSGASWYGTTSGTYWTINPKEYADPRKHGPEYQARARRAAGARPRPNAADAAQRAEARPGRSSRPGRAGRSRSSRRRRPRRSRRRPTPRSTAAALGLDRRARRSRRPDAAERAACARPRRAAATPATSRAPDPARAVADLARALTDPRTGGLRGAGRPGGRRLAADRPRASAGCSARSPAAAASPRPATHRSVR